MGRNDIMYGYILLIFNLPTLKVYDSFPCKGFLDYFESIVNRMAKNILDTNNAHESQNKPKVHTEELRETQVLRQRNLKPIQCLDLCTGVRI